MNRFLKIRARSGGTNHWGAFVHFCLCLMLSVVTTTRVFGDTDFPVVVENHEHSKSSELIDLWFFQTHVRHNFRAELIELVLGYTEHMRPALRLRPWTQSLTQQRAVSIMRSGRYAMFATLSDHRQFRMKELVRNEQPLMAGIMGFRLLLSNKNQLPKLAEVQSLQQLRDEIRFGFGRHWRDYSILESNGLKLVGTPHYSNLFPMLEAGRFDAIPRGLNETLSEQDYWQKRFEGLDNFKDYALFYPYPVYFYMHEDYAWVVERINYGIFRAVQDGQMKALFERAFAEEIQWLRVHQPKVFLLDNKFLENKPQIDNVCWWATLPLREHLSSKISSTCN